MKRRGFLRTAAVTAGVGCVGLSALGEEKQAEGGALKVAACGLCCSACPALIAGKCKGCATGKGASEEMLKKPCPVLQCAAAKKIEFCGSCKMFTQCKKLVGKPYDQNFLAAIAKKLEG